jgi:hypothetical protein
MNKLPANECAQPDLRTAGVWNRNAQFPVLVEQSSAASQERACILDVLEDLTGDNEVVGRFVLRRHVARHIEVREFGGRIDGFEDGKTIVVNINSDNVWPFQRQELAVEQVVRFQPLTGIRTISGTEVENSPLITTKVTQECLARPNE